MKKVIVAFILLLASNCGYAQKFKEWFRQKKTQKEYLIEQIAYLKLYLELSEKGYKIAKEGLTTIGEIKNKEFKLHKNRFDSLAIVKPSIKEHAVTTSIVGQVRGAIILYWQLPDMLQKSKWLTAQEKIYIQSVFDRLALDGVNLLDELKSITTDGNFSMSDDARMERIHILYLDAQKIYEFGRQLFAETDLLSTQRKKEKENIENSRIMSGID